MTPKRKLYSFWIDPETADRLKVVKARADMTESDQIRAAINEWLDRQERKKRRTRTKK